ncbi:MAG: baseplate J/gp47 family protein, partial [Chloroflexota bacterium]
EQIIEVAPDDEIGAIRDRLTWVDAPRVVLVVSRRNKAMRDKMNLKLLQRTAVDHSIQLALVAHHRDTVRLAQEIGLPLFLTAGKIGWRSWHGAQPQFVPDDDGDELKVIPPTEPRISRTYKLLGAITLGAFVLIIAALIVLLAPSARVTLAPVSEQTMVKLDVTASTDVKNVSASLGKIPAQITELQLDGLEQIAPIAKKDVPDAKATGIVVFTNKTDQPINIPKGSFVTTSAGVPIRFQTTNAIDLPGRGRVEVAVASVEPGPNGNVAKFTLNVAEGPFALAVNVVNPNATAGGSVKRVPVVSDEDKRRVEEILTQRLRQEAITRFPTTVQENEFIAPETVVVTLDSKTFDKFVDEPADLLTLSAHATARGLLVNGANANIVALERLKAQARTGFELLPNSIQFTPSVVRVANSDSVRFEMIAQAQTTAALDRNVIADSVRGMTPKQAVEWLTQHQSLRRTPVVELKSDWFGLGRLPYFAFRTQVEVVP